MGSSSSCSSSFLILLKTHVRVCVRQFEVCEKSEEKMDFFSRICRKIVFIVNRK